MPTKDFFSDSDSGRENTKGNRAPREQDDPFAGMQKLNFDFFDEGTDGAQNAGGASSFDALFDELPQEPARAAQPAPRTARPASGAAAPAPFVLEQEPSGNAAAKPPKAAPAQRPAQTGTAASRTGTPTRRAAQPSFDLSALEKEIDRQSQTSRPEALEGYVPLSFDFSSDDAPRAARPSAAAQRSPAAPAASRPAAQRSTAEPVSTQSAAPAAAQRPAETSRPAAPAPFVMEARPPAAPAAPSAAAPTASAPSAAPSAAAQRSTAAPVSTQSAAPAAAQRPSAPAARRPAAPAQSGGLAPGQGAAPRPASRSVDYSTISFSLGDVNVEAPTMAFMPIEQINSAASAKDEANRRAAERNASVSQPAQSGDTRAARMAKERNIGAAVFSALMEQDAGSAPAARSASSGGVSRASAATMEWPAAPYATAGGLRTPKPINWRTQGEMAGTTGTVRAGGTDGEASQPVPPSDAQPVSPPAAAPAPQPPSAAPEDGLTPLDFNFDDIDSFDPPNDTPARKPQRGMELLDLYDSDPDEQPRRSRSGRGSGGERPPRKPSGSGTGKAPAKTIFAWCGILLIAVLVILLFVVFGDKDGSSSSSGSNSVSASIPEVLPSESLPVEPVTTPIPRDEWYMVLANRDSVLAADFAVEQTETVGEALVDARIAEALRQMVNDAAAAGIRLKPTNGYRTVARQQELWNARVQKLMTENGLSQADAEVQALNYTSRAGTSDHNTGLGLDIVSEDYPGKDEGYANTAAAAWLAEHAVDYGFILRYPSDKTDVTGMDFEPYHYRYVGTEQAQLIKAGGLCLEEYLAQ